MAIFFVLDALSQAEKDADAGSIKNGKAPNSRQSKKKQLPHKGKTTPTSSQSPRQEKGRPSMERAGKNATRKS